MAANPAQAKILGEGLFLAEMNLHAANVALLELLHEEAGLKAEIAAETEPGKKSELEQQLKDFQDTRLTPAKANQTSLHLKFKRALTEAEKHHAVCKDRSAKQGLGTRIVAMRLNAATDDLREADEAILGTLQLIAKSRANIEAATLTYGSESLRGSEVKAHRALLTLLKAQQKTRLQHCNTIDNLCKEISAYPRSNVRDAAVLNARSTVLLGEQTQLLQDNTAEIEFCHRKFALLLPSIEVAAARVEQLEKLNLREPSEKTKQDLVRAKGKLRALSSMARALLVLDELHDNEVALMNEYERISQAAWTKLDTLGYGDGTAEKKALRLARNRTENAKSTMLADEKTTWDGLCVKHPSLMSLSPRAITSEMQIRAAFTAKRLVNMTRSPQEIARSDDLYARYVSMLGVLRPGVEAERDKAAIAENMKSIMKPLMPYGEKHTIEHWCEGSTIDFIKRKSKEELAQLEAFAVARQRYEDSHGALTLTVVAADDSFYVVSTETRSLYSYISAQLKQLSAHGTSLRDRKILDNIALVLRLAEKERDYKGGLVEEAVNAAIIKRFNELGIEYQQQHDKADNDPTIGPAANVINAMTMPDGGRVVLSAEVPFSHLRRGLLAQCYTENQGAYAGSQIMKAVECIQRAYSAVASGVSAHKGELAALVDALEFRAHDRIDGYAITERKATTEKPAAIILEQGEGADKATITFESAGNGTRTRAEVRSKNRDSEVAATAIAATHLARGAQNRAVSIDLSSVKCPLLFLRLFVGTDRVTQNLQNQADYLQGILDKGIVPVLEPYARKDPQKAVWNTYKALLKMDKKIGSSSQLADNYLGVVCNDHNDELKGSLIDSLLAETGEVDEVGARVATMLLGNVGVSSSTYTKKELMAAVAGGAPINVPVVIKEQAKKDSKAIKADRDIIAPKR